MNFERELKEIERKLDFLVSHYNVKDDEFKVELCNLKRYLIECQIAFFKS
jgi:hypothetical protein